MNDTGLKKTVKTAELFDCDIDYLKDFFAQAEYPWQLLPHIKELAAELTANGIPGFTKLRDGLWVGENVRIAATATLEGNIILGPGTEVRPGAYLRGNVITGPDCVLGNSSEFKNCILLRHVQAPHYNYVGDSILGNGAHMGAGAICSNLKSDGRNVIVHGDEEYETGLRKFGAMLGDKADIGCGAVLNPGTVIGRGTGVYPLTSVRGVIPPGCIVKSSEETVIRR